MFLTSNIHLRQEQHNIQKRLSTENELSSLNNKLRSPLELHSLKYRLTATTRL